MRNTAAAMVAADSAVVAAVAATVGNTAATANAKDIAVFVVVVKNTAIAAAGGLCPHA